MSGKSALLFGATGATGKYILRELLSSPHYSKVGEYGRRVTDVLQLKQALDEATVDGKLEQKVIDFEKLDEAKLAEGKWDVVVIALGTTRAAAGSAAAFEKIDREYVLSAAEKAKSTDPAHEQKLVYLSAGGASAKSPFLYPKSKGLTEIGLAKLSYSDTIIFRPGFLRNAERSQGRLVEDLYGNFLKLTHPLGFTTLEIPVSTLAKSIVNASVLGSSSLPPSAEATRETVEGGGSLTLISNSGALKLAETKV